MQRGDGSYRKSENCETAVNKFHHNVGKYLLRCCGIFTNVSPPLIETLYTYINPHKLQLFLEFECPNRKIREKFYEKIPGTTMLAVITYRVELTYR